MFKRFTTVVLAGLVASTAFGVTPAFADHDNGNHKDGGKETPDESKHCAFGTWRNEVQGRPAGFQRGSALGFYVWHNASGWRLYVTHPGTDKVALSGTITSNGGDIHAVDRRFEGTDTVTTTGSRVVSFSVNNYGGLDGIDFRTKCAPSLTFDLSVNGVQATPQQVFLGKAAVNPATMPFTEARANPQPLPVEPSGKDDQGKNCHMSRWAGFVDGRPRGFQRSSAEGFYLWHNEGGFHLFVTHPVKGQEVAMSGTITSSGPISAISRRFESNDTVTTTGANLVSFDVKNYGGLDGLHFRTRCAQSVTFSLFIRGVQAPAGQVYLGRDGAHPAAVPFSLQRTPKPTAKPSKGRRHGPKAKKHVRR